MLFWRAVQALKKEMVAIQSNKNSESTDELQKLAEKAVSSFEKYQHAEIQKMRAALQQFENVSKSMLRKEFDKKARVAKKRKQYFACA